MKFINLGGATGILEHKGKRMLFDPWHEDHCSLGTLKFLNKDAEIILMDRKPNFVENFLIKNDLKFKKIHKVKPYTPYELSPDLILDMVTADPDHELNFVIDSGLIIKWDNITIYNLNDCPPYVGSTEYVSKNYPSIDLALLPYSTGSSYPACFKNLSESEKLSEKDRLFKMGLQLFNDTVKELKPKYAIPFADQYVIVGSSHLLNKYMPNPSCPGVIKDFLDKEVVERLLLLNSGQSIDLENNKKNPDVPYKFYALDKKLEYAKNHSSSTYDFEHFELSKSVPLKELVHQSSKRLFSYLEKSQLKLDTTLCIEVTDWKFKFIFDLREKTVQEVQYEMNIKEPYLKVEVSANLLMMLLIGHISWNIADAALFITYERIPNNYNPEVHALWNYIRI